MKRLLLTILLLPFFACSKEEPKIVRKEVPLRVIVPPDVAAMMGSVKKIYEERFRDSAQAVVLQLESMHALQAAEKISSGEIKPDAWLAAPSSIKDYSNGRIINLGAKQASCQPVFFTPIVAVTQERFVSSFKDLDFVFSWEEFFDIVVYAANSANQLASPSFAIAMPDRSASGLTALLNLIHLAGGTQSDQIKLARIKDEKFFEKLRRFLNKIAYYSPSDEAMFHLASSSHSRIFFALTTERELIKYNLLNTDPAKKLFALYPKEGGVPLDYVMCLSDADWVVPAQKAAFTSFISFLSSPQAQQIFISNGFRVALSDENKREFGKFSSWGARAYLQQTPQVSAEPGVIDYVSRHKENFTRPSASVYVLDTSGTTTGSVLSAGKSMMRAILATSQPRDVSSAIAFSEKVEILSDFSSDHASKIKEFDKQQASGGSSLYDALATALRNLSSEKVSDYRKNLYVFTDGKDNGSQMSLFTLLDLIRETRRYNDINCEIVVMMQPGVDISDIEKIAIALNANLYKADLSRINQVIVDLASVF